MVKVPRVGAPWHWAGIEASRRSSIGINTSKSRQRRGRSDAASNGRATLTTDCHVAGITRNPTDAWMRQAARNLTSGGCDLLAKCRYLIRDRDAKFSSGFDMIMRSVGMEPLALPPRSPNLNAFAERFVRSIKNECLDRTIFFGEASLRHAVTEYVAHYHQERTHQGKDNRLLFPQHTSDPLPRDGPVHCRERLGGLLKFYYKEAA